MILSKDEEAVSAAIATVMLFAGVLSIIAIMLTAMVPVIEELEGAIEESAISQQMRDLNTQIQTLAESGLEGEKTTSHLRGIEGKIGWDPEPSGTWFTMTHIPNTSFRLDDVHDRDSEIALQHPNVDLQTVCLSDLRFDPIAPMRYVVPLSLDRVVLSSNGNSAKAKPLQLELQMENAQDLQYTLPPTGALEIELPVNRGATTLLSSHMVDLLGIRGQEGAALLEPTKIEQNGKGRNWITGIPKGNLTLHAISDGPGTLEWSIGTQSGEREWGHSGTASITHATFETSRVEIQTSRPAHIIMLWSDNTSTPSNGAITWPTSGGASSGRHFSPPPIEGTLLLINRHTGTVSAEVGGGVLTVPPSSAIRASWTGNEVGGVIASGNLEVQWLPTTDKNAIGSWREGSLTWRSASDTKQISGSAFTMPMASAGDPTSPTHNDASVEVILSGKETIATILNFIQRPQTELNLTTPTSTISSTEFSESWDWLNISSTNQPIRILEIIGDDGIIPIPSDGWKRCIELDLRASGWIRFEIPWNSAEGLDISEIVRDIRLGKHPSGLQIDTWSTVNDKLERTGRGWIIPLNALTYSYQTMGRDLEVRTAGGMVGTNHPEFRPKILDLPSERAGPGPRLSITVPRIHEAAGSAIGQGIADLDLQLEGRTSWVSGTAYEVRRGWVGPYGSAFALQATENLAFSEDWLLFPGLDERLNDYAGWIPDPPSPGGTELIYHVQGRPVIFGLQTADIELYAAVMS